MTGVRGLDNSSTSSASFAVMRRLLGPERGFSFEASAGFDRAWDLDKLLSPKGDYRGTPKIHLSLTNGRGLHGPEMLPGGQTAGRWH
jgi:hypothetical protein